jgi:TRAP-type transport system periplasmic protein
MNRFNAGLVMLLGLIAGALPTAATAQTEIKFLSTFDGRYPGTPLVSDRFVEGVKSASKGRYTFRISGPEVVPGPEQFQPVQKGAFDVLFTVQPWHVNVASVSMGLYTMEADPEGWRKNGIFDYVDRDYQRHNLKLLSVIPGQAPGTGTYQVLLKEELKPGQDLTGKKVRANPFYKAFTDQVGAAMVTLQGGEIYGALQRGTIDGVFWPVIGAVDFKWYEQAKFMMRPRWGSSYHLILMNLDRFNKLDPGDQALFIEEGRKLEVIGMKALDERTNKEIVELAAKGMKETTMDQAKFERAREAFTQGLWSLAFSSKASGEEARKFHEFLKGKGLAK